MCRCRSLLHWQLNSLQFFYLWDIKGRNRHLYVQNNFLCCRNKVCGDCIVPSACTQGNTLWCGFILNQVLYETQKKFLAVQSFIFSRFPLEKNIFTAASQQLARFHRTTLLFDNLMQISSHHASCILICDNLEVFACVRGTRLGSAQHSSAWTVVQLRFQASFISHMGGGCCIFNLSNKQPRFNCCLSVLILWFIHY